MENNRVGVWSIGLSTCGKTIDEELFKEYQQAGITDMEISVAYDKYADLDYKRMQAWASAYDIKLWSYHLPFCPFEDIEISKRNVAKSTISYFSELIKKGVDIGIDNFVIHPSGEPIEETERAERMKCAKESLAELAEIAARSGATIAVENLPRTCLGRNSAEILELISVHPDLRVCFDTNHLLHEDIPTFIRKVGSKVITLHVSDYDFLNERHWLPGEGDVNWPEVLSALREIGYAGPWLYEVGYAPTKIIQRRKLSARDFVDNAQMIFAGERPEAIGRRTPDLKQWK